ncbi:hypothetical protein [Variovorax sp. MHTC-1]|nr:hypothetical protein [Variovorax sp. MHTC-1]
MQRRNFVLATALAATTGAARAQHHLPVSPSLVEPYAKLQRGVPHLTLA